MIEQTVGTAATIMSILTSIGLFLQAWKIHHNKSSDDVSLITIILIEISMATWLLYGIILNDLPLIISDIFGTIATASIIVMWFRYRPKVRK